MYDVNVNVVANGMINRPSKPYGPINDNLTGCLQRCVDLGYERMIDCLILPRNNIVPGMTPRAHNSESQRRTRGTG
jgi:hypothetical protein